ncbi:trimethylamine methyltransferase family protein, partial [Candidatus Bipolaricaulota bacterium]|nr:trimethylamine methyltransferase family protein [Candidatus Bipolaricaulota bacterium]
MYCYCQFGSGKKGVIKLREGTRGGQLQLVSPEQVNKIHEAALTILEEKGILVEEPATRELLSDGGCEVDEES